MAEPDRTRRDSRPIDLDRFAEAILRVVHRPGHSEGLRAIANDLVQLLGSRPDAAALLREAIDRKLNIDGTVRLLRRPRLIAGREALADRQGAAGTREVGRGIQL